MPVPFSRGVAVRFCSLPFLLLLLVLCFAPLLPAQSVPAASGGSVLSTLPVRLQQARDLRFRQDYYRAIDVLQLLVAENPVYLPAWYELALCHYYLQEYTQALSYIARSYAVGPRTPDLINLEAFCHISNGNSGAALLLFQEVLTRQSNNRDAIFGLALLDTANGRPAAARQGLNEALRSHPRDARLLMALALVLNAEGRTAESLSVRAEALRWAGTDYTIHYTAALLEQENNNVTEAVRLARVVLAEQAKHTGALNLLAAVYYDQAAYEASLTALDQTLQHDADNVQSWFLLGQVCAAYGRALQESGDSEQAALLYGNAEDAFAYLLQLRPDDEFTRLALENLIMQTTGFEDERRAEYAAWRFERAAAFEKSWLYDKALEEYQRGLALDPYAGSGRQRYAMLLKSKGLPSIFLSELNFLKSIGKTNLAVDDALEIYTSLLQGSVAREWGYNPVQQSSNQPYSLMVFSTGPGGIPWHSGSDMVFSRYVRDLLAASSQLQLPATAPRVYSFADAFRPARESGSDYFLLLDLRESEREIYVRAELRVSRTGTLVQSMETSRFGNDRVQQAASYIVNSVQAALPMQGRLLQRRADRGLINLGRLHGLSVGDELILLRPEVLQLRLDAPGFLYKESDILADLTIVRLDDELAEVQIKRRGFFDRSNPGDLVLHRPAPAEISDTGSVVSSGHLVDAAAVGDASAVGSAGVSPVRPSSPFLFDQLRRLF